MINTKHWKENNIEKEKTRDSGPKPIPGLFVNYPTQKKTEGGVSPW